MTLPTQNPKDFVIARSEATRRPEREARGSTLGVQSPGTMFVAPQFFDGLYQEIATA